MNIFKSKWYNFFIFEGAIFVLSMVFFSLIGASVIGAFVPYYISNLSRVYSNIDLYNKELLSLVFLFLLIFINRVVYEMFIRSYVVKIVLNVRKICYQKWILSYDVNIGNDSFKEKYPQGEIMSRIMNDTEAFIELITSGTFNIFIDMFFVISCMISFITMNQVAGGFIIIIEIIASALLIYGSKYMRKIFLSVRFSRATVSRTLANLVGGIRDAFYLRHEDYASKKGIIVFEDFLKKQLIANMWDASYYSLAESLYPLLLAGVIIIFPYSGITELAIILAMVDLIQRSINPIKNSASKIANVQRAASGLIRISEFTKDLDKQFQTPIEKIPKKEVELLSFEIDLPFFSYEGGSKSKFSLKNVKIVGEKGELIGIVGISGSGKSTLLNIIAGNILPNNLNLVINCVGEKVTFDVHDRENFIRYKQYTGLVSQDSHIFSETLSFNISMDKIKPKDFDNYWIWLIGHIDYLRSFKFGPDDLINPDELSAGQKQLIAGIRACYLKKPIVLFDEISSALDSSLEQALRKVVLLIQKNSLTISVSHRLETVIKADKIYVLDDGQIVASGNHQNLVNKSTHYNEFIEEITHKNGE